ncbi:enterotoxin [Xenorhabdus beddingii]|uniref:Enterotoxin n=1 Tax=Xenorhabdus beddingii TaxID=40578 RepID=A0A1Y2SUB9_9GAMM|nr:enterotoxin [Xenorhabdus beddingii]OTA21843.1 enterotoxin [Xenorhabdus beddingii]
MKIKTLKKITLSLLASSVLYHAPVWADSWRLEGNHYRVTVSDEHGKVTQLKFENTKNHDQIITDNLFEITLKSGEKLAAQDFQVTDISKKHNRIVVSLKYDDIQVKNIITVGDKAKYGSFEITITPQEKALALSSVSLMPFRTKNPFVDGTIVSSPIISDSFFIVPGNPLINTEVNKGSTSQKMALSIPLEPGKTLNYKTYVGVYQERQLRRNVNEFLNNARPRKYSPYLHYNSWFDIGFLNLYTEQEALTRIKQFGQELVTKRGVTLSGYLFDDGWDNLKGDWGFSQEFPYEFKNLKQAADQYHVGLGIWLSPWGGYSEPAEQRVSHAAEFGYEVINGRFALSGPNYYANFHNRVLNLIQQQNVSMFKLDGIDNTERVIKGSSFSRDSDAVIHLMEDMRSTGKDLFINLTIGPQATPSWLFFADSIWRDGHDVGFYGAGSKVQQWLTYRDAETYHNVVRKGPLFPLNSLTLHGIVYAKQAEHLDKQLLKDFADQVWSYFGSGTQLQEMYITPELLTIADWDTLANAAKWSEKNKDVLFDTHWIGKDPKESEVYGWAAWSPKKSIITLRNPADEVTHYYLDLQTDLELPDNQPLVYDVKIDYGENSSVPKVINKAALIILQPLETLTFSLTPVK